MFRRNVQYCSAPIDQVITTMKSRLASRRKALKIKQDEEEDDVNLSVDSTSGHNHPPPSLPPLSPVSVKSGQILSDHAYFPYRQIADEKGGLAKEPLVKRPSLTPRGSGHFRKSTSLRLSFGPGGAATAATNEDADETASEVFTPKKSRLSREALETASSQRRSRIAQIGGDSRILPIRRHGDEDRPSYSKEDLDELRDATPLAPKDLKDLSIRQSSRNVSLDIVAKFGAQPTSLLESAIPSEAEIREKKERRARLAREHEYISLGDHGQEADDDDEAEDKNGVALPSRPKWEETRLVREDEDLAEGFDDFVDDGKISLGKKAEMNRKQQEREMMRQMIEEAEVHRSDEDYDGSEEDRRAAYEEAQTRAGTNRTTTTESSRRQTLAPTRFAPIPTLAGCIERLETSLQEIEASRAQNAARLEEVARRKVEAVNRKAELQRLLEETAAKYERLRAEAGLDGGVSTPPTTAGTGRIGGQLGAATTRFSLERGLESFGSLQTGPVHE